MWKSVADTWSVSTKIVRATSRRREVVAVGVVHGDAHAGERLVERAVLRTRGRHDDLPSRQLDAERRPAGRRAVRAVEHLDREVRQQAAVDPGDRAGGVRHALEGRRRDVVTNRSEEEGDRHRRPHGVDDELGVGVQPVVRVVPWQPHEPAVGEVGRVDDEGVVAVGAERAPRIVEAEVPERGDADLVEQPAEPLDEVVAGVQAVVEHQRLGVAGRSEESPDRAPLLELGVVDRVEEVTELGERSPARCRAAISAAVIAPALVPATRGNRYPASARVSTAPTSPMPLTPPPSSTRSRAWSVVRAVSFMT